MGQADYYKHGGWNVICDRCGFKRKNSDMRMEWDGLFVCADTCWEQDHPQKFIRVQESGIAAPIIRDDPPPTYLDVCYIYQIQAYSGLGASGCMASGIHNIPFLFLKTLADSTPQDNGG